MPGINKIKWRKVSFGLLDFGICIIWDEQEFILSLSISSSWITDTELFSELIYFT